MPCERVQYTDVELTNVRLATVIRGAKALGVTCKIDKDGEYGSVRLSGYSIRLIQVKGKLEIRVSENVSGKEATSYIQQLFAHGTIYETAEKLNWKVQRLSENSYRIQKLTSTGSNDSFTVEILANGVIKMKAETPISPVNHLTADRFFKTIALLGETRIEKLKRQVKELYHRTEVEHTH